MKMGRSLLGTVARHGTDIESPVADRGTTTQIYFFTRAVTGMIDRFVEGINCTIFAYGQTGSGKTFTISGIEERISDDTSGSQWDGLIPRSVRYAFERIAASQEGR